MPKLGLKVCYKTGLFWLWIALLVIVLDQTAKYLVLYKLSIVGYFVVTPFLNIVLAHNPGAAFSFLAGAGGWQSWIFGAVAIIISIVLLIWLYKTPRKQLWLSTSLNLILGGAIGNLLDRIMHGFVVDFVDFHIAAWHYATFNLADTAIVIGAIMLILRAFLSSRHPADQNKDLFL